MPLKKQKIERDAYYTLDGRRVKVIGIGRHGKVTILTEHGFVKDDVPAKDLQPWND
jgi:hypothetical protein